MMKQLLRLAFVFSITLHSNVSAFADEKAPNKTTVASLKEDDYDVHYVKLEIEANHTSTTINGKATTQATVTAASMSEYVFEISNQLTLDSIKINGTTLPAQRVGDVASVQLNTPISVGNSFEAIAWYHGQPTGGSGFFSNGLLNQTDASIPVQVTHTVSAAYHSKDWWPCKQSLRDKIDSADIWVTVPTGLRVASNGLLQQVTPVSPLSNRYEWALRSKVDYYLLSFAVAPYNEYNYYMHFAGGDSMLVQNFIYQDTSLLTQHKDELDSIAHLINHFSTLFGKYPFYKEKFGICQTPLGGGMENQTMVSLGSLDMSLIAHELAHQWWGDHVTCGTIEDMWLNEGIATYAEHLYLEHFRGTATAKAYRTSVFNTAMGGIAGSVWVNDTTNEFRIYDSRLTYNKGAALTHMLRYMVNNDATFFAILQAYQQQYGGATATTQDLKNLATQISGVVLDTFFQQWYKGEGYPTYSARWYQDANGEVAIKLLQTTSRPFSVSFFKMPVEIKLMSPLGDTLIRVLHTMNGEEYRFTWAHTMSGMTIDPETHILKRLGTNTKDATLSLTNAAQNTLKVYPNPTADTWIVSGMPLPAKLRLYSTTGQLLWQQHSWQTHTQIPAATLSSGTYILQIEKNSTEVINYYLNKQ